MAQLDNGDMDKYLDDELTSFLDDKKTPPSEPSTPPVQQQEKPVEAPQKQKRKMSERQLEALRKGRETRWLKKQEALQDQPKATEVDTTEITHPVPSTKRRKIHAKPPPVPQAPLSPDSDSYPSSSSLSESASPSEMSSDSEPDLPMPPKLKRENASIPEKNQRAIAKLKKYYDRKNMGHPLFV